MRHLIPLFAVLLSSVQAGPVVLCRDGRARAVIVLPERPAPCVEVAARELIAHVRLITGVELPQIQVADGQPLAAMAKGRVPILLGDSAWAREQGIKPRELPAEGFVVRVRQNLVIVAGHDGPSYGQNYRFNTDPAGTLYGVYRLLEGLGIRWVYPGAGGCSYPETPGELSVPEGEVRDAPYFAYRHTQYGEFLWGRRTSAGGDRDVWSTRHTSSTDLQKNHRQPHPDWFLPNANGEPGAQADLTHPEVVRTLAEMAGKRFASLGQAGLKYYLVIPLDGRALPADDARSQWVTKAVVAVANQLGESHPDGRIVYCAYNDYKKPPAELKRLPENVVVLIAQSRASLLDETKREEAYELVRAWQQRRPKAIYFCRYSGGRLGMVPALIPRTIARDLQGLKRLSETGLAPIRGEMNFVGVKAGSPFSWWEHINEYVTAKLLWNPDQDVAAILDDLCQHQFGPAAPPMRRLLDGCEKAYAAAAERDLFSPKTIRSLEALLAEAKELAKDSPPHAARVAFIEAGFAPLRRMRAKQEDVTPAPENPDAELILRLGFEKGEKLRGTLRQTTWADGIKGRGLRLAEPGACVQLEPIPLRDCDYSYEAWIKPDRCVQGDQFLFGPAMWERQMLKIDYGLPTNDGHSGRLVLKHRRWEGGKSIRLVSAPQEFRVGQWYHVVGTFSRKNGMALYLNGQLVGLNMALTEPSDMDLLHIGASGQGRTREPDDTFAPFQGVLDEVGIYRRELSLREVRQRYLELRP